MDKTSFFILNIFLNSFLTFFTVVFLIEGIIFLFRIKQGRAAAILRIIPILKLPLDLFLYDFSRWSYAKGINPWSWEEGSTRALNIVFGGMHSLPDWPFLPIASGIQFFAADHMTFTLADGIGHKLNPFILTVFALLFIFFTAGFMIRRLFLYYRSFKTLDSLAHGSQLLNRKMCNSGLASSIRKWGVHIRTSPTLTGSPFVAGLMTSVVYIPSHLSDILSRKEYEAVLAHEMEHIRYKDCLVRLVLDFIGSVFWWIPMKGLRHRIEEGQEVGCDLKCKSYGIDLTNLASALCKSAKYSINTPSPIFTHHLTKHAIGRRINIILQPRPMQFKKIRFTFYCLVVGIAYLMIFLGRFWIF